MPTKEPRGGRLVHLLATLAFAAFIVLALFLRKGAERPDVPVPDPPRAVGSTPPDSARAGTAAPTQAEASKPPSPAPSTPPPPRVQVPDGRSAPTSATPADEVTETPTKLRWSLDKDGIPGAVREAKPAMIECYEGWLKVHPALAGKLVVVFEIEAQEDDDGEPVGRVAKASLGHSELDHPFVEGCVLSAFSEMEFEAPTDGPLKVRYPLTFDRRDEEDDRDAGSP